MPRLTVAGPAGKGFFSLAFLSIFLLLQLPARAQQETSGGEGDTLAISAEESATVVDSMAHDPHKAALYSALLPGLGQIYNKKYWKVPIIYVGFGTLVYFIDHNNRYYKDLKNGLIAANNDSINYTLKYFKYALSPEQMQNGKDIYKRWRDLSIILTGGFYVLQIIDATVDAYLFDWDVGEDISLHIEPGPVILPNGPPNTFGLRACLSF
ncbi:MAG TPA: DUF5683 domain-containing protein [Bacteroidales bacterium]|nr:DUF5683 domain-containing protein [Bacteroidales bacterium]